jgi:GAF domain
MKPYTIQLPCLELLAPDEIYGDKDALKEYAWSHWKDEIQRRLIVELPTIPTVVEDGNCSNSSFITQFSFMQDEKSDNTTTTVCTDLTANTRIEGAAQDSKNTHGTQGIITSPNHSLPKKLDLLNTIARVQRQFFYSESRQVVFGTMLDALLDLLDSEYGFIGEIKINEKTGKQYLHNHAVTNIAWDDATRKFYDDNVASGLVFTNLHSLFGKVITTASPVISNDPKTDKRGCGIPKGHPPLDHFLGIPFFMPGGEMNGMVGISNKPGGYSEEDIEFLEVRLSFCRNVELAPVSACILTN